MLDLILSAYGLLNLVIALTSYALGVGLIFHVVKRSGTPLRRERDEVLVLIVGPCLMAVVLVIFACFSMFLMLALEDFGAGPALQRLGMEWAIDVIAYIVLFSPGLFASTFVTGVLRLLGLFRGTAEIR
jgi:hypothetical protein